tara:strand:- start:685 stop:825 length:141 start_codon:yes stop_codon:yes gene_type:complete
MPFLLKILFTLIFLTIVGGAIFLAINDVSIPQDTITKEIPIEQTQK